MIKSGETDTNNYKKMLYISIIFVFTVWASSFILFFFYKPNNVGEIGDVFGMVSSLFTALAFAFLIYTSSLQREELKHSRAELVATRIELAKTAEAHEKNYALSKKQYDSTIRERVGELKLIEQVREKHENQKYFKQVSFEVLYSNIIIKNVKISNAQDDIKINEGRKKINYNEGDDYTILLKSERKIIDPQIIISYQCLNDNKYTQRYYWNSNKIYPPKIEEA